MAPIHKLISKIAPLKPLIALAYSVEAKREAFFAFSHRRSPPVLIYQMGKVGSSTVYASLKKARIPSPILHLHFLSKKLSKHRYIHEEAGVYPVPYNIYLGEEVRKRISNIHNPTIKIISLIRDPIAHVVSGVFQNPYLFGSAILTAQGTIDPQKAALYINRKLNEPRTFYFTYEWFNTELKSVFNIDVFSRPFPVNEGYAVYSRNNVEALVIRLEDLTDQGPEVISNFLNLDTPLTLIQKNVRDHSSEKSAYLEFRQNISISPLKSKEIYSSKFVKHFYNDRLINRFTATWTGS